jgi:receptor protein-tyrosine kinase
MNTGDNDPSSYLRMFSAAQTPIEPKKASTKKVLGVLFGLAFFLAIALPVAVDVIDQRVVSPAEVKRAIGFPPVGLVLQPAVATRAFAEEHFRRLVNGIQRGMAAQGAKCVVITPLDDARNPASLVTDLAAALRVRGLKTVIVDANPGPDSHNAGREDTVTAPVHTVAAPLSAIPAPVPTGNTLVQNGDSRNVERARIPVEGGLGSFVRDVRKEYDVVLIDTPPLELSADAEFLASVSDITLMVAESGKATRRELAEGTARLGRIGAPSVGVIMSQVSLRHAGSALKRDFKKFSSLSGSTPSNGTPSDDAFSGNGHSNGLLSGGAKPPKSSRFRLRVKFRPDLGLGRKRTEL